MIKRKHNFAIRSHTITLFVVVCLKAFIKYNNQA